MDTIALISKEPFPLDQLHARLGRFWQVARGAHGQLVIEVNNSRIYLYPNEESPSQVGTHELFIDYSDIHLVKQVIEAVANTDKLIVDNDFETVLPGDQFIEKMRLEPDWNWKEERRRERQ